ncbi:SDR family oxidoreductase [Vibrio salinus]|uniref:SDR family oxidoreductase n=1 Tax=Vibrio salinus TaxID=2899784 RepID=UPI001E2FF17B|nr:SDR family oxidoreductase [Vibrio salinus]MCE0494924.1 SDR family oxidoreductase [Vibrio salinus]
MDVYNKRILLTGATGGIGEQIAKELAFKGAKLVLVARDIQKLEQLMSALESPYHHEIISCDLANDESIRLMDCKLKTLIKTWNEGIDIVINNAGHNQFQLLSRKNTGQIYSELSLNLTGPILVSKYAINGWLNQPGLILNIGSTFGGIGYPGYAVYGAAKSGLYRFTEALNREMHGSNIKVHYLAPRATKTRLNSQQVNDLNSELGNHVDTPDYVAGQVLKMIHTEREYCWLGWPEKLFVRVNQILPGLVSKSIQKQLPTIYRYMTTSGTK